MIWHHYPMLHIKVSSFSFLCYKSNTNYNPAFQTHLQAWWPGSSSAPSWQLQPQQQESGHPHRLVGKTRKCPLQNKQAKWEKVRKSDLNKNLRSVLLAMVPLKEREIDFLDSSSAGVCSRGTGLTGWSVGEGPWKENIMINDTFCIK